MDPDAAPLPSRAVKQRAILRSLAAAPDGLPRAEAGAGSPAALAALIRGGLVQIRDVEVTRDPFAAATEPSDAPKPLAPAQAEALQVIRQALAGRRFAPILLHGVTGSGKTEVYLQAIETALAQGQQALVLVPEISLTPLAVQRFLARFGGRVAVLHSGLRGGERFDAWRRIKGGGADIVVGARSAVFAPLPRLGILVVDEEHDPSYKQDEAPRYHGRDVAIMRAKSLGAPVILGSATPSLESFERAQAGRYALVRLPERIEARPLPRVEIVDLRRVDGGERLLSPPLCDAIAERLARGEQSLLFLNRRGFSTLLLCEECGATLDCPRCSISLTFHAARGRLCCHTCDFERRPPAQCPECHGTRLRYLGFGTQQLEAAVRERFPKARVDRMDRDTTGNWRAAERILRRLTQGEIDILVGTQMIGKGHDVPNVTLVGVVSADMALHLPDFGRGNAPSPSLPRWWAERARRPAGHGADPDLQPGPLHPARGARAGVRHAVGGRESLAPGAEPPALFPRRPGDAEQPAGKGGGNGRHGAGPALPRGRDARRCRERARARPALPPALSLPMAPAGMRTGSAQTPHPRPRGGAPPARLPALPRRPVGRGRGPGIGMLTQSIHDGFVNTLDRMTEDHGMSLHENGADLARPHALLAKLQRDFLRLRRTPWDPHLAFDFFATAAHLPSWIEVAGGPNACRLPPTPLLKAVWQIVDGEAPLVPAGAIPSERHLMVELDGWPARTLGATVRVLDLASQVLIYWETIEFFANNPEETSE